MKKFLNNKYLIILIVALLMGFLLGMLNITIINKKVISNNNDKVIDLDKIRENGNNENENIISDDSIVSDDNKNNVNNKLNSSNNDNKVDSNKSGVTNNSSSDWKSSSKNNTNNTNTNKGNVSNKNNNTDTSPKPSPTSTANPTFSLEPTQAPKTQSDINDEYRKQLQNKFGVSIAYKDELGDYYINGYDAPTKQYDDNIIYDRLQEINTALSKYPANFFYEIKNTRMNITIYLVKDLQAGIAALTNASNRSNVIVMINTISAVSFERTLHHELMHCIDSYISFNLGYGVIESTMATVNPVGFTYGNRDDTYVYNFSNASTAYFLSNYSKTNYLEDRAVLFADLMVRSIKKDYLYSGTPIFNKAILISNQLNDNFETVKNSSNVYWNRLLK